MKNILLFRIILLVSWVAIIQAEAQTPANPANSYGITRMTDLSSLPVLDKGVRVHYEGSIDKQGANADWDWWLYQDKRGEWVIFDVDGPGCIYNFVQHRYISSQNPVFRFYFDGEDTPRFTIRSDEFGEKYPFIEPLASKYIGPVAGGLGPIRVIRSFVPMPYQKSCRITSDVKLEGFERVKGHGGWGHVTCHSYASADSIRTYTGKEDYQPLVQLWKHTGSDPKAGSNKTALRAPEQTIAPGGSTTLFDRDGAGSLAALRLYIAGMTAARLQDVWVHMSWDNHTTPDVSCPIGCLFGNSLGYNDVHYLLMGASTDGWFYNYFPMPFWKHLSVTIENRSRENVRIGFAEATISNDIYDSSRCGYFRSSKYYERKHTPGSDSHIGAIRGTGKLVAAHVTCYYAKRPGANACEGDVRVHIDGLKTPQIESDGSESYICYGWGFPSPVETNPSSGYDGLANSPWSMTRICTGDSYPFYSGLRFGIESGGNNNQDLEHSGALFYYGKDAVTLVATDSLDIGSPKSVKQHKYQAQGNAVKEDIETFFEGDDDHIPVKGQISRFTGQSSFTVKISPRNEGVRLRRRSDQKEPRQCARVFVDGKEVTGKLWYFADHNPYKRWLEDEFEIPAGMTAGKSSLQIRIVPVPANEGVSTWNESTYRVFSYNQE